MVAWYWLIVSAMCGIVFAKVCEEIFDWDNFLTETIAFITMVVLFVPLVFYGMFLKLTLHPVSEKRMEEVGIVPTLRVGNFCLCFDIKAKHIWNKMFVLRIKKEKECDKND